MSILIPGMELPKDDEQYHRITIYGNGQVIIDHGTYYEEAEAIELPEHGRLIDADELLEDHGLGTYCPECKRDERSCQFEMIHTTMDFCEWIEDAHTIIEAEGVE